MPGRDLTSSRRVPLYMQMQPQPTGWIPGLRGYKPATASSAGLQRCFDSTLHNISEVPEVTVGTDAGARAGGRWMCQCSCGCRRRPGRRIACRYCWKLIGPGCCWEADHGCCHVCFEQDCFNSWATGTSHHTCDHGTWESVHLLRLPGELNGIYVGEEFCLKFFRLLFTLYI